MMAYDYVEAGVAPYTHIFRQAKKGHEQIEILEKIDKAKAGIYEFVELYCVIPGCDCRKVLLQAFNEKQRQVALIEFPLDINTRLAFPDLVEGVKQSAAAEEILDVFTEYISEAPEWYQGMCQRYRTVRKKIDKKPYKGKRFPSKNYLTSLIESPEMSSDEIQRFLDDALVDFAESDYSDQPSEGFQQGKPETIADLVNLFRSFENSEFFATDAIKKQLRSVVMVHEDTAEDLAQILVALYGDNDEVGLEAALLLLGEVMAILRTDLERKRIDAEKRMSFWQKTLAQHIFTAHVDLELGGAVTGVLLDARVDILPHLYQANVERMHDFPLHELHPDDPLETLMQQLLASMDELDMASPYEMVDALLQMMAITDIEVQLALVEQLFYAGNDMAQESAALLLFHPHQEVRERVADLLAAAPGKQFTATILRRLIISRNWFPKQMQKKLDLSISNARRARIDCAPLQKGAPKMHAYASTIDGANAQSLQIVISQRGQYRGCSMMPKKGFGVADAFLIPLENKGHMQHFKEIVQTEVGGLEVSSTYIDQRLCYALADGARVDRVPNHWLLAIAEQLGQDQWKAISFDCRGELEQLRKQLKSKKPAALSDLKRQQALSASSHWPKKFLFADSWFEDDNDVDNLLENFFTQHLNCQHEEPIDLLIEQILEPRRAEWLERLVVTASWLKAAKKAPLQWEQMYHVATAVADNDQLLKQIPLMRTIAEHSVGAFWGRLEDGQNNG